MKKFNLLMLLLLTVTTISAQTFDLGEGRKATLDQAGNYRLTWNQKSQNGGSVSGTFSGKLKEGKRDGIWKGSFTYKLYSSNEGLFKSGTVNFIRTYSNGIPNGAYSYNSTLKVCNGSFDYLSKQWKYGKFENFAEQITGSFKNGHVDGKWYAYQQQPYEKITMQFDNGKAVGTWTIAERASQTLGFKNGYLVQQKEMRSDGWGTELSYAPDEKLEELPNQKTVKVSNFLAYGDYYMKGASFDEWWRLYPENASNEDYTAYYILADYDNHLKYIGNVPEWKKASLGIDDATLKRKAEEKEAQAFYDKHIVGYENFIKTNNLHKLYELLGYSELSVIAYWKPIVEKEPNIKLYGQRNDKLLKITSNIRQEKDFNKWYNEKFNKLVAEAIAHHTMEANDPELSIKIVNLLLENYPTNWENFLKISLKKWKTEQITNATQNILPDDIYTYLIKYDYVTVKESLGNVYSSMRPRIKVIIEGDLRKVTKEAVLKHKKLYMEAWLEKKGTTQGFSYEGYMPFGNMLPVVRENKKLNKQLLKAGLLHE